VTSSECFCHLLLQQDADILADRGQTLNANQQQLVLMNGMIFGELGVLIGLTEKFATVRHTHTHTHTHSLTQRAHIYAHTHSCVTTRGQPCLTMSVSAHTY
jgi:hypothetical protein